MCVHEVCVGCLRVRPHCAEQDDFFSRFNDYEDFCFQCEEYSDLACCPGKDCKKAYCLQCAGFDCMEDVPESGWQGLCYDKKAGKRSATAAAVGELAPKTQRGSK